MATREWRGDAPEVSRVVEVTIATPEAGDVFWVAINGKRVEYTATGTSASAVATGLAAAIEASDLSEFDDVTATASGSKVILTGTAGVDFEVTVGASDAGDFEVEVETLTAGVAATNEKQRISIGSPTGGTFTLTFDAQTTAAIAYNADAATVQAALEALSNIASGDVVVTGDAGGPWTVEFEQAYAGENVPLITGSGSSLTGGGSVTIAVVTDGYAPRNEIQEITIANADFGSETGITFRFDGEASASVWNPTLAVVAAAIENMANIGAGNVSVTGGTLSGGSWTYRIEFTGTLAAANQPAMTYGFAGVAATEGTATTIQDGSSTGANEVQRATIGGNPTGGTFTLTFRGDTTAGIAYNASASAVQSALEAITSVGAGNVAVTGNAGGPYTITFQGALAAQDVSELTGSGASLTGGAVNVSVTQTASSGTNEVQQISFNETPGGGTFTLTFDGQTTAGIAYNASASTVQTALEALSNIGSGDVVVVGDDGGPWTITFTGALAATDVAEMTGDGSSLTGGGSQSITAVTTTEGSGPNWWNEPDNWTGGAVPSTGDIVHVASGNSDILYGLQQRDTFTADASSDELTLASGRPLFVADQKVRVRSSGTLPAGLSAGTDYYVLSPDGGTLQLSATEGGSAIDITDAGTGTHTIEVILDKLHIQQRYTGRIGLADRRQDGTWEYLPTDLELGATTIVVGAGDGSGSGLLRINTGPLQTALTVVTTGGSEVEGVPTLLWQGTHASNTVHLIDGELGIAFRPGETATVDTLEMDGGTLRGGAGLTLGDIEKNSGDLLLDGSTVNGTWIVRG